MFNFFVTISGIYTPVYFFKIPETGKNIPDDCLIRHNKVSQ